MIRCLFFVLQILQIAWGGILLLDYNRVRAPIERVLLDGIAP